MALGDHLTVTDLALEAYERALMPMLNDGHFDSTFAPINNCLVSAFVGAGRETRAGIDGLPTGSAPIAC